MIDELDCRAALADCFLDLSDSRIQNQAYDDALKYIDLAIGFFIAQNRDLSYSRIEASLRAIANIIPAEKEKADTNPLYPSRKPVCLHVLKEAFAFGGHTAMATRWMKLDSEDRIHSVVLLDQQLSPPAELAQAVSESGGEIFIADRKSAPLRQAAWLRELARNLASYVILHVDTSNLIASVAFGKEIGPPVLLVNHAAHIFWVGVSIPDMIVNCHGSLLEEHWTTIQRGAKNCATIPIPLLEAGTFAAAEPDRRERKSRAREIIGVPKESILIMTVGASYKYNPIGKLDFLKTCQDILEVVPDAFILAAGVIEDDRWRDASNKLGFRLRALGSLSQSDIALLHQASDLYIEGFPMGSYTALLESGLQGLPAVLAPAECPPPYSSDGVALDDTLERPDSLDRYKLEVVRLCGNPAERISAGLRLRNSILAHHTGAGWKRYLTTALQALPPEHRIYPIQAPLRTPPAIYEYWSEFEKTRSQSMSILILEDQIFRAFTFGLRPKITPEMKRAWRNAKRFRTGGVIPLRFLSLLCNYCLPLLPLPLARIIFRTVKFSFRGGLVGRARDKAVRLFRGTDDSKSPEGQYRYLPEQSKWLSGPTVSARNMVTNKIPYLDLQTQFHSIRGEVLAALETVCESARFAQGPITAEFEQAFADYCGARHCVSLNSGTSALHLAMRCLDVGPGDEVITVPMTFIATTWAISYTGARPVFVDISPERRTMDPGKLEAAIGRRTKAILPVHLFGQPADMEPILRIASRHGIPVIEDAAQAHGALYQGRRVGQFGVMGCFSFYPGKNLGAYGEGGALVTNDDGFAARARALRDHGQSRRYYHDEIGYNYRMDSFQAAVLNIKLDQLDERNALRIQKALRYSELLKGLPVKLPAFYQDSKAVWHCYVIECDRRDEVRSRLLEAGIETGIHYPVPVHLQRAYSFLGRRPGDFTLSEEFSRHCLSLPIYPELTDLQIQSVANALREAVVK